MPKETINNPTTPNDKELVIGWNKIGWVQASIYPPGWETTGDAFIADLSPNDVTKLIKVLKRAKRQAYRAGQIHTGFENS